jgi:glycosyltransferase involved in cell wall biosynthesis
VAGPLLLCLLPVRNGASHLDRWLDNVASFADGVVALDDGSTDGTYDLLQSSPLVNNLLRNPRRETFHGWDDGENRRRLLAAAADFNPQFVLSLDADETIYEPDSVRLRGFLQHDALVGSAYSLRHLRCWGDYVSTHVHQVFRLFGYRKGQTFHSQQLHFSPIPTSIDRRMWFHTSLRLLHHGAPDEHAVAARIAKYREADPSNTFADGHGAFSLNGTPDTLGVITPQPSDSPVLAGAVDPEAFELSPGSQRTEPSCP